MPANTKDNLKNQAAQTLTFGVRKTRELKFYLARFGFRLIIVLLTFGFYIYDKSKLSNLMNTPFWKEFSLIHVIWVIFMITMISHLIPNNRLSMAWRKARENEYRPDPNYERLSLMEFVSSMNIRAWGVMLVWIILNAAIGALYLFKVIGDAELLLITVFYYLSDYICILFFCPFQSFIMKNKCCVNCRIYDWGHFMMFTPMLFIRNFYSWSLFFTALVVLIHWELIYSKHPERFWEGSNVTLRCENCKERTCAIKRGKVRKNVR